MNAPEHSIVIERTMQAGAGDIFAAFTLPELLNRWMTRHAESDLRVGGAYRYELDGPDGAVFVHKGEFLALEPGELLRQTFIVESDEPNPYANEFIELKLQPVSSGRTAVRFTNGWDGPAMSEEDRGAVRDSWAAWLDQLERFLAFVALHAEEGEALSPSENGRPRALKIVRTFDASPERVFEAWVNPGLAARWLFYSEGERTACELEARPGGRWLISDRREGLDYAATGRYLAVERPRLLSFTFAMPQFSPNADQITVQFSAAGALTLMHFEQSGPDIEEELSQVVPGAESGSEGGWNAMFDTLSKVLAS